MARYHISIAIVAPRQQPVAVILSDVKLKRSCLKKQKYIEKRLAI